MADFRKALSKGAERLVAVFIASEIRLKVAGEIGLTAGPRSDPITKETLTNILKAAEAYAGTLGIGQLPGTYDDVEEVIESALPEAISILASSGMHNIHHNLEYAYLDEETLARASRRGLR